MVVVVTLIVVLAVVVVLTSREKDCFALIKSEDETPQK